MQKIMSILGSLTGIYMLLIFIRVMFTWFSGAHFGKPAAIISRITDPYLAFWSRFPILRTSFIDLSPIAAMAALSLAQNVFTIVARSGFISLGLVLAIAISSLWSAASFILGFFAVILGLRLIAYLSNQNIYSPFWRIIDSISQPILYRITHFFFRSRIINYRSGIILSIVILLALMAAGKFAIRFVTPLLVQLPI
jgi:YggT family protein